MGIYVQLALGFLSTHQPTKQKKHIVSIVSPCGSTKDACVQLLRITVCFLFLSSLLPSAPLAKTQTVGLLVGSGGLGDQSYNDMTFSGLGKAQKEFGFKLIVEETYGSTASQEKALDILLKRGAGVIVANGAGLHNLIEDCAPNYPEKFFIVNDYTITGYKNIASTVFAHEEGSYLVGLLAALESKTQKIGFIGGVDIPVIYAFFDGYISGARHISPSISIETAFVSPAGDFSGFEEPAKGYEIATKMYQQGIDIIYSVAGLTGNGVIQAAVRQNKLVIGVDSDQDHLAKGHVLTSMMKRLDRSTYAEISKIFTGNFKPGVTFYSLQNGGISLTQMKYTNHLLSDKTTRLLQQAEKDIIDGKITFSK